MLCDQLGSKINKFVGPPSPTRAVFYDNNHVVLTLALVFLDGRGGPGTTGPTRSTATGPGTAADTSISPANLTPWRTASGWMWWTSSPGSSQKP